MSIANLKTIRVYRTRMRKKVQRNRQTWVSISRMWKFGLANCLSGEERIVDRVATFWWFWWEAAKVGPSWYSFNKTPGCEFSVADWEWSLGRSRREDSLCIDARIRSWRSWSAARAESSFSIAGKYPTPKTTPTSPFRILLLLQQSCVQREIQTTREFFWQIWETLNPKP